MSHPGHIFAALLRPGWSILSTVACLALVAGCTLDRERDLGGVHPAGWADESAPTFHGRYLEERKYPLADCRACHGQDYLGGATGVTCSTGNCHAKGVESCTTCHGDGTSPLPTTGAHPAHVGQCKSCHAVPTNTKGDFHPDGTVEVHFSGLAVADGATPTWDPVGRTCSGVYCHAGSTPAWSTPELPAPCGTCHGAPPASHARWTQDPDPASCEGCHPSGDAHLDTKVEVLPLACDACHGHGALGAPAPGLLGATDPAIRGVGAHARHLDPDLPDRMGKVVDCTVCHRVPASVAAPGHLDTSTPADLTLPPGATYDSATGNCVVGCHWDKSPGPQWTDASGAERACDACHGFPPAKTRDGGPHPPAPASGPTLALCLGCHPFTTETHVDGLVEMGP